MVKIKNNTFLSIFYTAIVIQYTISQLTNMWVLWLSF